MTEQLLIEDEANRKRALDLQSFIVEAPAGAGKTELLTQRYLMLLQTVNAPEEIIAITFTNKAAAEMRLRILDSLIAADKQTPPTLPHKQITYDLSLKALQKSQQNGWQIIENPSRLRIFTIDSLCAHLARQMPLLSRFGAQPSVTDDANILYTLAAEQTLALLEHVDFGDTIKTALRYVDNNAAQLTSLVVSMLAKRDQWLSYANKSLDAEQLQNTLNSLISDALREAENALPAALQLVLMPVARFAASNQPTSFDIDALLDWQKPLTANPDDLTQWRALADLMLTAAGEPRKEAGLNVKFGFPPTDEGKANRKILADIIAAVQNRHALQAARVLPFRAAEKNDWQNDFKVITDLSQLLNLAVAQLWLVFQAAGEVDFVEIAQRATQALADESEIPTDLALKLDYQIQHLLVDEFQDTSPSQIKLLEQLTRGWQRDDERTLFCVGDPMQSIYRFRKANVSLFIHAAEHGIGDIQLQRLQLYRNNRATSQIVGWLNQTFPALFAEFDNDAEGAVKYRASIADADASGHPLSNSLHEFDSPCKNPAASGVEVHAILKDEATEAAKQAEAEAVIKIIKREHAANPNANIAVLVSAKNHLRPLVSQLRRQHANIKFQALEIEALAGRQIVQDLLSLTHALHHKADRVHWLALLRAPWCGLTLHDLNALAGSNHHTTVWQLMQNDALVESLSADGQARLQYVRSILADAFQAQGRTSTSKWVRSVWLMLNGPACLWEQADVIDVQAFFGCLDVLDKRNQFSPERMNSEIEKLFAAPDVQGENLQMMTIHKSKGLEFDTVILLGLGTKTGGNNSEKPLLLWEEVRTNNTTNLLAAPFVPKGAREQDTTSVYDFLETREKLRDANEDARVLYVAATRAERKLHLVGFATKNKGEENKPGEMKPAANTPLSLLWPAVNQHFNNVEIAEKSKEVEGDIANFTPQLVRLKQLQIPALLETFNGKTTTQITAKKPTEKPIEIPTSTLNLAADAGTLAHLYCELIAKQGLQYWPASRIDACSQSMQYWLLQRGFAKSETETQVPLIINALKRIITSPQGAWILAARASTQTELSIQNGEKEQRIDVTFIDNGTRWIIDYKLGLDVTEANCEAAALAHQAQLAGYAALFISDGLPIKTAVFFISLAKLVELT